WNIYELGLAGGPAEALYPAEEEFSSPLWQLGQRPYAILEDGRLAVLHGAGGMRLGVLDPATGGPTGPGLPHPRVNPALAGGGGTPSVGVLGARGRRLPLTGPDANTGRVDVLCGETGAVPQPGSLPQPRHVELEGRFGQTVHALVYPPSNPEVVGPEGELPPYVVWAHGGPTSHVTALLDLEKAYFTSRGIGVIDVNDGG